jgi:hypothetical protein
VRDMTRRWLPNRLPWLLTLVALLLTARPALAHRLYARYLLLPGKIVKIEGYYSTNEPAVKANVHVLREDDSEFLPVSFTDDNGVFVFSVATAANLKVVIEHDGHRHTLHIPAKDLAALGPTSTGSATVGGDVAEPSQTTEILAGLSFILALAAFVLSVRTASRLRRLTPAADKPRPEPLPIGRGPS